MIRIKHIQARIAVLKKQNRVYEDGFKSLEKYLDLSILHSHSYVSIEDVKSRINEIKQKVNNVT